MIGPLLGIFGGCLAGFSFVLSRSWFGAFWAFSAAFWAFACLVEMHS